MITFIIPSKGRLTLPRTIQSLKRQTDSDFKTIVVYDGMHIQNEIPDITYMNIEKVGFKNAGGAVRNAAIPFVETDWVGFVDDDDTLLPSYVSDFREHVLLFPEADIFVFRCVFSDMKILPPKYTSDTLELTKVGIYFAIKTNVLKEFNFIPSGKEDWDLLRRCSEADKKIYLSPCINYAVQFDPQDITEIKSIQKQL
jgi:glycosyltransferase involved in cell wall biosynthesis